MSALDSLIKVKKQAKTDDLLTLLDEVIAYEKLSKIKTFRDLKTSETAQKRLPLLSGIYKNDLYSLAMVSMVINIIQHLDGNVPEVLTEPMEIIDKRDKKRMEMMEKSIIKVKYYALNEYDDEESHDDVVAVFSGETTPSAKQTAILVVTRKDGGYHIYQGYYEEAGDNVEQRKCTPYVYRDAQENQAELVIQTYSLQGNNAYPFALFRYQGQECGVMMPDYRRIWLMDEDEKKVRHKITMKQEQINQLNLVRPEIGKFAECLTEIIRGGIQDETVEGDTKFRFDVD